MKFAVSYSCGKDSTLAFHTMVEQGHEPVCLVVVVNEEAGRSYFHGADAAMLERYAGALGLPMITCPAKGETYHTALEEGLAKAKAMGAEAVCFGDIDIEQNRRWEEERCKAAGLTPCFPLWQRPREELVREVIALGYRCLIKSVRTPLLPPELLGRYLDENSIAVMRAADVDICGENGEYHTLAVDGPIFQKPLDFHMGKIRELDGHSVMEVW